MTSANSASATENPLLPHRTVKFASRCFKNGAAMGLFPWRFQPEVKSAPFLRREGLWTNLVFWLNIAYGPLVFVPATAYAVHGMIFLDWGQMQRMLCMLCLTGLSLPMVGGLALGHLDNIFTTTLEGWKHVDFLHGFLQTKSTQTPKLVLTSQMALEAVVFMTYSNTLSVALAAVLVPWLPLALSNAVELALGYKFPWPWKTVVKVFDFGAMCYVGHQCAEYIFELLVAFHCISICNTAVLRDFMLEKPKLVKQEVDEKYDVIVQIWRRIHILNIGFNECFAMTLLSLQIASIAMATGGAFAAIKIEGVIGVSLGSLALFMVLILIVVLEYSSLLGETMVEMKAKLERECRAHALLRRQVRSLRPAFLRAGSFYYIDKGCIVTCVMIIIDNVVNSLMMAKNN